MRIKRLVLGGGIALAAGFAYLGIRTLILLQRGADLVVASERFPKDYSVGEGKRVETVWMGDSTAVGVGVAQYEHSLPYVVLMGTRDAGTEVSVHNRAVSGAKLADVLREQLPKLPATAIDTVALSLSANDVTAGTDLSRFEADLMQLLTVLTERKVRRILLSTTPNFRETPAVPWPMSRRYEQRASQLAAIIRLMPFRFSQVRLADLHKEGTLRSDEYASDGFHPSDAGYRRWARIFADAAKAR